jgi:poly(hydroxyalkanoate) granule-associated protein
MNEAQSIDSGLEKLKSAGRSLWLASLGVVAEVEEGGRDLFGQLVERGRPFEERQRKALEQVGDRTGEAVREATQLVQDTVEFETKGVLKKLGLLTREDVQILTARLETLSRKLDDLAERQSIASAMTAIPENIAVTPAPKARRPRQRKQ